MEFDDLRFLARPLRNFSVKTIQPLSRLQTFKWLGGFGASLLIAGSILSTSEPTHAQTTNGFHQVAKVDGRAIWVKIVSPAERTVSWRSHIPWWQNGNTRSDRYYFAVSSPSNVKLAVKFSDTKKVRTARIFLMGRKNTSHQHVQYVLQTKAGPWTQKGKTNFNLQLDQFQGTKLTDVTRVGQYKFGVPGWQTEKLINGPGPQEGVPRFGGVLRLKNAPPYRVQSPIWVTFPYLGFGNGQNVNWVVENPSPIYFNVKTNQILQYPFVGFEEAGMYRFNSLTYPPAVDFESPFAFYGYVPNSRYAQEVIRAQQFPKGDPYAPEKMNRQQSYFRLSWKMNNPQLWKYSLEVQGFHAFHNLFTIGNSKVYAPSPNSYGQWLTSKSWPYVTFVQAMHGYTGSEGIYFDSGSSTPTVWPWLDGLSNNQPGYLTNPFLVNTTTVTNKTSQSLPVGYRMDSNPMYFQKPQLYIDRIDGLVHLWGATSGIENLGRGWILRFENYTKGPAFDGWIRERTSNSTQRSPQIASQLYEVGHFLVYSGRHHVEIVPLNRNPVLSKLNVPINRTTWQQFKTQSADFETGKSPWNLSTWFVAAGKVSTRWSSASLSQVHMTAQGLSADLSIDSHNQVQNSLLSRVPGSPGHYILRFNEKSNRWSISPGAVAQYQVLGRLVSQQTLRQNQPFRTKFEVINKAPVPQQTRVQVSINGHIVSSHVVNRLSSTVSFTQDFKPSHNGPLTIAILVNGKIMKEDRAFVLPAQRLSSDYLTVLSTHPFDIVFSVLITFGLGIIYFVATGWKNRLTQ